MTRIEESVYRAYGVNSLIEDWEYTSIIDDVVPQAVSDFMNADKLNYDIVKNAYNAFVEEIKKFPPMNSMDALDDSYRDDHKRFYNKYIDFARKCAENSKALGTSGYGGIKDYEKLKIADMCRTVDYNFPYGWKRG